MTVPITEPVTVRLAKASDLSRLEEMWRAFYADLTHVGLPPVRADGFARWSRPLLPLFESARMCLALAERGAEPIGYLLGYTRPFPPYLASRAELVGVIAELFVVQSHRRQGIASRLLELSLTWFRSQNAFRAELQVMVENAAAKALYRKLGWTEEHTQLVMTLGE